MITSKIRFPIRRWGLLIIFLFMVADTIFNFRADLLFLYILFWGAALVASLISANQNQNNDDGDIIIRAPLLLFELIFFSVSSQVAELFNPANYSYCWISVRVLVIVYILMLHTYMTIENICRFKLLTAILLLFVAVIYALLIWKLPYVITLPIIALSFIIAALPNGMKILLVFEDAVEDDESENEYLSYIVRFTDEDNKTYYEMIPQDFEGRIKVQVNFHTNIQKPQTISYTIIAPNKQEVKSSSLQISAEEIVTDNWIDIDYIDCNNTEGLWRINTSLNNDNDSKTLYVESQEYANYKELFEIKHFGMSGMDLYMDDFRHYGSLKTININSMDLVQAYMFIDVVKAEYKEVSEDFTDDIKFYLLFNVVNAAGEVLSKRRSVLSLANLSRFSLIVESFADDINGRFPQGDYNLEVFYKGNLILQAPFKLASRNLSGDYELETILKT